MLTPFGHSAAFAASCPSLSIRLLAQARLLTTVNILSFTLSNAGKGRFGTSCKRLPIMLQTYQRLANTPMHEMSCGIPHDHGNAFSSPAPPWERAGSTSHRLLAAGGSVFSPRRELMFGRMYGGAGMASSSKPAVAAWGQKSKQVGVDMGNGSADGSDSPPRKRRARAKDSEGPVLKKISKASTIATKTVAGRTDTQEVALEQLDKLLDHIRENVDEDAAGKLVKDIERIKNKLSKASVAAVAAQAVEQARNGTVAVARTDKKKPARSKSPEPDSAKQPDSDVSTELTTSSISDSAVSAGSPNGKPQSVREVAKDAQVGAGAVQRTAAKKRLKLVVYIDGASRGNPGLASFGVCIKDTNGNKIKSIARAIPPTTNNVAEWEGAIAGMVVAAEMGATDLELRSDSLLVTNQLMGKYKVKTQHLVPLYNRARQLSQHFNAFQITWVRREENTDADALANYALDNGDEVWDF